MNLRSAAASLVLCMAFATGCMPPKGNPIFKAPPANSIKSALKDMTAAINANDTTRFLNAFVWEARDSLGQWSTFRAVDSLLGYHVTTRMYDTASFYHTVHNPADTALYGNAFVRFNFANKLPEDGNTRGLSNSAPRTADTAAIVLRVDSGKWRIGQILWNRNHLSGYFNGALADTGKWRLTGWRPNTDYHTPPSNTIREALKFLETAINTRDSERYWAAFAWEKRENDPATKAMWDRLKDCRVALEFEGARTFTHTVHNQYELGQFARVNIKMTVA